MTNMKKHYFFCFVIFLFSLTLKAQTDNLQTRIYIHPDEQNRGCTLISEEVRFYSGEQVPQWMFNVQQFTQAEDLQTYLGNISDPECRFTLLGLDAMHQLVNSTPGDSIQVQGELLFNGARIPVEAKLIKNNTPKDGHLTTITFQVQATQLKAPVEGTIRFRFAIKVQ